MITRCDECGRLVDSHEEDMMFIGIDQVPRCMNHEPDPDEPEIDEDIEE